MLKTTQLFLLSLLVVSLSSCGNKEAENNVAGLLPVDVKVDDKLAYVKRKSAAQDSEGRLVFLYKQGAKLFLKTKSNNILIDENAKSQTHQWLSISGDYVYVFWWEKFGTSLDKTKKLNKTIYAKVSSDGGKTFGKKAIIHSDGARPLAKLDIVSDDKGNASVFYLDERIPAYETFVNSTHDGGETWSKDLMLNNETLKPFDEIVGTDKIQKSYFAVSPQISRLGSEIVAVWYESSNENGKSINRLFSRTSIDQGKTWGEKKEIYIDKDNFSLQLKVYQKKDRMFVVVTQAGKGLYVITKTEGSDWTEPSSLAPGTDQAKSASYIAMDADDTYLYVTYIKVPPNGGKKDWATVLQRYNYTEKKWEKSLHRFDAVFGMSKTRGGYQDITVLDDGSIVAVWEDYRFILPVILMSYSLDQGASWNNPFILNKPDNKVHAVEKFPFILQAKNKAQIFFEYSNLKEGGIPYASTKTIKLTSPKQPSFQELNLKEAVIISNEERKKALVSRFNDLMKARVAKNWDKAWGFIDPVYRNLYSKKSWVNLRGRLEYLDYKVLSATVEGADGKIAAIITFDIANSVQGVTPNAKHLKNKKKSTEMRWGWFGDDWYYIAEDPRAPYMP